jgi:hypothetical protein
MPQRGARSKSMHHIPPTPHDGAATVQRPFSSAYHARLSCVGIALALLTGQAKLLQKFEIAD